MYSLRYYTYKRSKKHANIGKIILYTHKTGGKTGRTCNTEGSEVGGIGEIAGRDLHCTRNGLTSLMKWDYGPITTNTHTMSGSCDHYQGPSCDHYQRIILRSLPKNTTSQSSNIHKVSVDSDIYAMLACVATGFNHELVRGVGQVSDWTSCDHCHHPKTLGRFEKK